MISQLWRKLSTVATQAASESINPGTPVPGKEEVEPEQEEIEPEEEVEPEQEEVELCPFSRLPGELRNMIWELALLDLVDEKPQLCFYRAGCWVTELSPEGHFSLTFDHKRLHPIAVSVPLFFVNREARSYARAWIQERGLQIRFDKETQCLGIYRPVNPDRDTLYVPEARFECFQDEPAALKHGFRAAGVRISGWPRSFMRLAFPAALFSNDGEPYMLHKSYWRYYPSPEITLIVNDPPGTFLTANCQARVGQPWALESVPGLSKPLVQWPQLREDMERFRRPPGNPAQGGHHLMMVLSNYDRDGDGAARDVRSPWLQIRAATAVRVG